ncbi:MAG: hypothetical protein WA891_09140 [Acidobacteriaceae bacterium]|jgi:hypothetical protein
MKRKLDRVLRIRALLEDLSRLEFEKKIANMRFLEMAAEQQRHLARSLRADALQMLEEDQSVRRESWPMRIADAEILDWKEARFEALADESQGAVREAREALLARRLERRQVEALLATAAREEKKGQVRREQNLTDDWYQSGRSREDPRRR